MKNRPAVSNTYCLCCAGHFRYHYQNALELRAIIIKFAESGWDLIDAPAKAWLSGEKCKDELIAAVEKADIECGSCGCEFDPLYKRFLEMKDIL